MNTFLPADILLPKTDSFDKWSVIACDQFTSQQEYWDLVKEVVKDSYSSYYCILPEIYLSKNNEDEIHMIHQKMKEYMDLHLFKEYKNSYIYVERTLMNGKIRKGIVGMVDLEQYDYHENVDSSIRASEKTVLERIPPRKKIRQNAPIELPHILLLCDDEKKLLIEPVSQKKESLEKLYDFSLMMDGGHIEGYLLQGNDVKEFQSQLEQYDKEMHDRHGSSILFATGDGNHSLATAKACWEDLKQSLTPEQRETHPARYALVELENIHDEAQEFEPIHRFIKDVDVNALIKECKEKITASQGYPIQWIEKDHIETIYLNPELGQLDVGILQSFLDEYLKDHKGTIDYIHGDEVIKDLAKQENSIGFILPVMNKEQFFKTIVKDGSLPRKTFSMGNAQEKRYYLEARTIQ